MMLSSSPVVSVSAPSWLSLPWVPLLSSKRLATMSPHNLRFVLLFPLRCSGAPAPYLLTFSVGCLFLCSGCLTFLSFDDLMVLWVLPHTRPKIVHDRHVRNIDDWMEILWMAVLGSWGRLHVFHSLL
ncbi:hypothetical protein QWA68_003904 [Fusarium oxysporum]|nr:hypothetical protein QWA68_003904 [Fusarium oxysporum]